MSTFLVPFGAVDEIRALLRVGRAAVRSFGPRIPDGVLDEFAQEAVTRWLSSGGICHPSGFVRRVARNLAVDHLRRTRRESAEPVEAWFDPWARVEARLELVRVWALVRAAPTGHRRALERLVSVDGRVDEWVAWELRERGGDREQVRAAVYKRRARATAWLRARRDREASGPIDALRASPAARS